MMSSMQHYDLYSTQLIILAESAHIPSDYKAYNLINVAVQISQLNISQIYK